MHYRGGDRLDNYFTGRKANIAHWIGRAFLLADPSRRHGADQAEVLIDLALGLPHPSSHYQLSP